MYDILIHARYQCNLSDAIRDPMGKVSRQIENEGESSICSSIIVASELRYGGFQLSTGEDKPIAVVASVLDATVNPTKRIMADCLPIADSRSNHRIAGSTPLL